MFNYASRSFLISRLRLYSIALISFWCTGLILGSVLSFVDRPFFLLLMHQAVAQPVSIVGLFISGLFPFLVSVIASYFNKPALVLAVCMIESACFAFSGILLLDLFSSASWIVRGLFLFSDYLVLSSLLIYWHFAFEAKCSVLSDKRIYGVICLVSVFLDYFIISHFLQDLF